ncbi:unnamed protein product, partial [Ectocarpus sp. 12 AP-2014]
DAFIVALNQTCDGGKRRWYASTLELQRVSLAFCGACRCVPTLHVRVDQQTPRSLWSPRQSHTTASKRSREVYIVSRVPAVQAFGLTWALPTEVLLQSPAIELGSGLAYQRMNGYSSAPSLGSMFWLKKLNWLLLELDTPVNKTSSLPASLQQLSFGDCFDQPLSEVVWPAFLQQLSFGLHFNQPLDEVAWPTSLQHLSLGDSFNQP